jgi:hypothetical protein
LLSIECETRVQWVLSPAYLFPPDLNREEFKVSTGTTIMKMNFKQSELGRNT